MRESLEHVDSGVMSKIFNTDTFGLEHGNREDEDDEDDESSLTPNLKAQPQQQEHASDAIDYSDFNEAVPDDQIFNEKYYKRGMGIVQTKQQMPKSRLRIVTEDYDDEEEEEEPVHVKTEEGQDQQQLMIPSSALAQFPSSATTTLLQQQQKQKQVMGTIPELPKSPPRQVDIKELFPAFEQEKVLKFTELFTTKLKQRSKLASNKRGNNN